MIRLLITFAVVASWSASTVVWGHPGHAFDTAATDWAHRVTSPHHWLEAVLALSLLTLAARWLVAGVLAGSRRHAVTREEL